MRQGGATRPKVRRHFDPGCTVRPSSNAGLLTLGVAGTTPNLTVTPASNVLTLSRGTVTTTGGSSSGETVPFTAFRADGGSGTVMLMGHIPFKPGAVYATDLTKLVVKDNTGTEKVIALKAAESRFPDNATYANRSLRGCFFQCTHSVTAGTSLAFTIEIGGAARSTTDVTYVEPIYASGTATVPAMTHYAYVIPDDAQYWCDTFALLTPLIPYATESASASKTWFRTDTGTSRSFRGWTATNLTNNPDAGFGNANYEHVHGLLAGAARASTTADRVYFFTRFAKSLVDQLITGSPTAPNYFGVGSAAGATQYAKVWGWDASLPVVADTSQYGYGLETKHGCSISWAVGYLATGWSQPRRKLCQMLNWSWSTGLSTYTALKNAMVTTGDEFRFNFHIRIFQHVIPYIVEAVDNMDGVYGGDRDNATEDFNVTMPWIIDALAEFAFTTPAYKAGVVGQRSGVPLFLNYQLRIVANFLIFYWNNIKQDARIPAMVETIGAYLLSQMYHDTGTNEVALAYTGLTPPMLVSDVGSSEWYSYCPYLTEIFGWLYAYTGVTSWKTWGDRFANEIATRRNAAGHSEQPTIKNQGEYFHGFGQSYQYYIHGGTTTPVSGAHNVAGAIVRVPTPSF